MREAHWPGDVQRLDRRGGGAYPALANGRTHLTRLIWRPQDVSGATRAQTVSFSTLGPYQLMATPGRDGTTNITGLPLAPVDSILRDVGITEPAVFSATLVLTGLLGTGFVRLSLRPLRRVAATATRVTQLPLASGEVTLPDRVPGANPRTEVGQVAVAFNRMLGHVESALGRRAASEARLRRFAADASHELRTPLAAIRGYAELALRHPGPVPADIEHALHRVESESERMSVLVDELLLLAQLDAGRPLAREPVDLTRLAIDATSDARVAAASHRWLLELPGEPVLVRGDEHRLHQVLANLMSNAAKHTPPGHRGHRRAGGRPGTRHRRADRHRRRPRHPPGPAAHPVRAVRPRRLLPLPRNRRSRQHRPRPGHRGRRHHRPRRPGPGGEQTRPDPVRHHPAPPGRLKALPRPGRLRAGVPSQSRVGPGLRPAPQRRFTAPVHSAGSQPEQTAPPPVTAGPRPPSARRARPRSAASGEPVMAIGGFNGTDQAPSLAEFKKLVAAHDVHYFIGANGHTFGGGSGDAAQITSWVQAHFTKQTVGGLTVYNLARPATS